MIYQITGPRRQIIIAETAVPLSLSEKGQEQKWMDPWTNAHLQENDLEMTQTRPLFQFASSDHDIALHIWIVDNSTSMNLYDRYRFEHGTRKIKCTRWDELKQTIMFQARWAARTEAPTIFRLINSCPDVALEYSIASSLSLKNRHDDCLQKDLHNLERSFQSYKPMGKTLLANAIYEIRSHIISIKDSLQATSQIVVLTLATDGLPSDEFGRVGAEQAEIFVNALRMIEEWPVILIVRLSTDEKEIRQFYTQLRRRVELRIVILNDFITEADQIQRANPWLTYTPTIHRIREFGHSPPSMDHVSERLLTPFEMRDCCIFILGPDYVNSIYDPMSNWSGFIWSLKQAMRESSTSSSRQHPVRQALIDIRQLNNAYQPSRQRYRPWIRCCLIFKSVWSLFVRR